MGKYASPRILDVEVLRAAHEALEVAEIHLADFSVIAKKLKRGDFAYFDPPYVPVSKTANFTAYASDPFGPKEQERLATELARLKKAGVYAMLSNAATPEMKALYVHHGFVVDSIQAARSINSDPSKRGDVTELVVTTYDLPAAKPAKPAAKPAKPAAKPAKPAARRRAAV